MAAAAPLAAAPKTAPALKGRGRSSTAATPFGMLQAKLALAPIGDSFEHQADSAARHVTANRPGAPMISALPPGGMAQRACAACAAKDEKKGRVQRKCACGGNHDEPCSCGKKQEKKLEEEKAEKVDSHPEMEIDRAAKREPARQPADPLGAVDRVVKGPGRPLPDPVRADMEAGFGRSFSHVRVHEGPRAAQSADAIGAHAYTVGNHIAFNRGQFQPGTESGRFLLAHELAHTVQQSGAPAPAQTRISQPGDRHEAQANRAAGAALSGAAMPVLSPAGATVGRYSFGEFLDDAGDAASAAGGAIYDAPGDIYDAAGDAVDALAGIASDVKDAIYGIASAIGSDVSWDGTTAVIDVPSFDPCPELEFRMQLSDLGLDPTLYFPIVAGALGIGIVEVIGVLGAEVNLDPGFGFKLAGCKFGPGQIRINALSFSPSISLAGQLSVKGTSMLSLGGDIGVAGDLFGLIAWPDPPFVIIVPLIGLSVGGTYQLMAQIGGEITGKASAKMGLGGVSAANLLSADIGVALDLGYGGYGSLRILGQELCRVGWPLGQKHWDAAARFSLATSVSVGTGGIGFSFGVSATPMATNPLADLGFAFDASRLEDDCPLCKFMTDNKLMPGQKGINWANPAYQAKLPRFGGPMRDVMQRDPGLKSTAQCRGTCGVDCPEGTCTKPYDLILCRNVQDPKDGVRHVWHTYYNYAKCGTHKGCKDHDACYDAAAEMPVWGFGGFMIGPMYRVCDLEALCGYSFKQAVTWAGGGGPYQKPRLRYADRYTVEKGCLGPCPEEKEADEGGTVQETCIPDRQLWERLEVEREWGEELFNDNLITGVIPVPYVGELFYGVNGLARADASLFAELGPINLMNACLIYDPATMTYSGKADMTLFANVGASASITGALEGFLSDPLCFLNWITLRGTINAGLVGQLPSNLTVGVDLYCEKGDLHVLPRVGFETCLNLTGELNAGIDVFLLSFNVWGREWNLARGTILEECWDMEITFSPFSVGETPTFDVASAMGALDALLDHLLPVAIERDDNRTPARNPLPAAPRLLFPCLGGNDDDDNDDDDDGPSQVECPTKATGEDGRRIVPHADDRGPRWPSTGTISIPGGGSDTVGHIMEAPFLEKDITGGSEPGTQNNIYGNPGIPTQGCFTRPKKDTQRFVRGHLLNAEIGGPGRGENGLKNLFPITGQMNTNHKTRVERGSEGVVTRVHADELLYYKVTVTGEKTPREIVNPDTGVGHGFYEVRSTFMCEVADYNLCTDDTLRKNPSRFVPVTQDFVFAPSADKVFDEITDPNAC